MVTTRERRWVSVAEGVWVCRHDDLDLSTGFVLGADAGLVIDTGANLAVGAALRAETAELAGLPGSGPELALSIVYTHAHYDHCFGTAPFLRPGPTRGRTGAVPVWAHARCRAELAEFGVRQRETVVASLRGTGRDVEAELIAAVEPVLPTRTLTTSATVELGGRDVQLIHPGTGHTDHDVVVVIPDADVVFAGDLVEAGAPPSFEGSHPAAWPGTLTRLLDLLGPTAAATTVVPGHGDPVDTAFVEAQREEIVAVLDACRSGRTDAGPYPREVMEHALAAFLHAG